MLPADKSESAFEMTHIHASFTLTRLYMKYWGSVNVVEKRHGGDCYGSQRDGFETIVYEHIRVENRKKCERCVWPTCTNLTL